MLINSEDWGWGITIALVMKDTLFTLDAMIWCRFTGKHFIWHPAKKKYFIDLTHVILGNIRILLPKLRWQHQYCSQVSLWHRAIARKWLSEISVVYNYAAEIEGHYNYNVLHPYFVKYTYYILIVLNQNFLFCFILNHRRYMFYCSNL